MSRRSRSRPIRAEVRALFEPQPSKAPEPAVAQYKLESIEDIELFTPLSSPVPHDWVKGQLLNVRHGGQGYRVTVLGEEFDPRYPERCLEFSSSFDCQQFVSSWYSRQSHDPRAL
jgi:hypothetical protein